MSGKNIAREMQINSVTVQQANKTLKNNDLIYLNRKPMGILNVMFLKVLRL